MLRVIIKVVFYTRKAHFDTALLAMFFLSMSVGHIAMARDLGNAAEINDRIT